MVTVNNNAITQIAKSIAIHETSNGKVPGCYAGKTFELTHRPIDELRFSPARYVCYSSKLKNGKEISFQHFLDSHPNRPNWFVHKGNRAGTWLYDVEVQ